MATRSTKPTSPRTARPRTVKPSVKVLDITLFITVVVDDGGPLRKEVVRADVGIAEWDASIPTLFKDAEEQVLKSLANDG